MFDDFDIFDGTELITYERRDLQGSVTQYANVRALRRAVTGEPIKGPNGSLIGSDTVRWHIKASTLPITPRRDDRIVSVSGTWAVLTDDIETFGNRYVCNCRKVA